MPVDFAFEINLLTIPDRGDWPLAPFDSLASFLPGTDHLTSHVEALVSSQNYCTAYLHRHHASQFWQSLNNWTPRTSVKGTKTKALHYEIIPRKYVDYLLVQAAIKFSAAGSSGTLTVTNTAGVPDEDFDIPIATVNGATQYAYTSSLIRLNMGGLVTALDIHLTSNDVDRMELLAFAISDADIKRQDLP